MRKTRSGEIVVETVSENGSPKGFENLLSVPKSVVYSTYFRARNILDYSWRELNF